jgi:hypothetical protein
MRPTLGWASPVKRRSLGSTSAFLAPDDEQRLELNRLHLTAEDGNEWALAEVSRLRRLDPTRRAAVGERPSAARAAPRGRARGRQPAEAPHRAEAAPGGAGRSERRARPNGAGRRIPRVACSAGRCSKTSRTAAATATGQTRWGSGEGCGRPPAYARQRAGRHGSRPRITYAHAPTPTGAACHFLDRLSYRRNQS